MPSQIHLPFLVDICAAGYEYIARTSCISGIFLAQKSCLSISHLTFGSGRDRDRPDAALEAHAVAVARTLLEAVLGVAKTTVGATAALVRP